SKMITAEVYPVKSRNLVDDEDDEFPTPAPAEMHLVFDSQNAAEQRPGCLVVQLDNSAAVLVSSVIVQTGAQRAGYIAQDGRKAAAGEIFQSETCRILQFAEHPAQEVCFALVN